MAPHHDETSTLELLTDVRRLLPLEDEHNAA
jgi:hypothetical protein